MASRAILRLVLIIEVVLIISCIVCSVNGAKVSPHSPVSQGSGDSVDSMKANSDGRQDIKTKKKHQSVGRVLDQVANRKVSEALLADTKQQQIPKPKLKSNQAWSKQRRRAMSNNDGEEPERVRRGVFGGVSLEEFLRIAEESREMALEARRAWGENVDEPKTPLHRRLFHGMPYKEWFRHLEEVRQEMSKKYKYRS